MLKYQTFPYILLMKWRERTKKKPPHSTFHLSWSACVHQCIPRDTWQGMGRATLLLWQHPSGTGIPRWLGMLCGMQDAQWDGNALLHRACMRGWLCSVSSPDQQLFLYPCLLIPALTVLFIADLLFLCISKEMQIWNLIRRMRHDSQCLPNSLVSVSTSIRDRSLQQL